MDEGLFDFVALLRRAMEGQQPTSQIIFQDGQPVVYPGTHPCDLISFGATNHKKPWDVYNPDCHLCWHVLSNFPDRWKLKNLCDDQHNHVFITKFNEEHDIQQLIQEDQVDFAWRTSLESLFHVLELVDKNQYCGLSVCFESLKTVTSKAPEELREHSAWDRAISTEDLQWNWARNAFDIHDPKRCTLSSHPFQVCPCNLLDIWPTTLCPSPVRPGPSGPPPSDFSCASGNCWSDTEADDDMATSDTQSAIIDWMEVSNTVNLSSHFDERDALSSQASSTIPSVIDASLSSFTNFDPAHSGFSDLLVEKSEWTWEQTHDDADLYDDEQMETTVDGTMDRVLKKRSHQAYMATPMAVFIHAGAGYHSLQNESVHLAMCSKAALEAMKRLRAGATAVQAVEAAIKVLENNEITNAGYGSNLSIEGMVECDATMVDHFGRSGACGAVPNIKNPISLAKLILDTSSKTLSLRRVPPNFLVGDGAKQFAIEHGMSLVTNEQLTSRNANDRYQKWRADLQRARGEAPTTTSNISSPGQAPSTDRTKVDERSQDQMTPRTKAHKGLQRDHTSAILNGMWNEGQPDSPSSDPNSLVVTGSDAATPTKTRSPLSGVPNSTKRLGPGSSACASDTSLAASPAKRVKTLKDERARLAQDESKWMSKTDATDDVISVDGFSGGDTPIGFDLHRASQPGTPKLATTELTAEPNDADFDLITDTMGAIAIDALGNIAAGSSSGGIGMKHMGRTGPAALVGIGTAVIPVDEEDEEGRTVAAVTSGTGEHMATTMAAQKCAERLFHRTRRGPAGRDVPEDDDSIVMRSFVLNDFMGHPGVRSQASARAIGVMAIEVTNKGIYLNWAHNTESFALASMGSYEKTPCTVMSRLPEGHGVNIGARKIFNLGQPPDR